MYLIDYITHEWQDSGKVLARSMKKYKSHLLVELSIFNLDNGIYLIMRYLREHYIPLN